jgi:hypothetical protein
MATAVQTSVVISQYSVVTFEVLDKSYSKPPKEAKEVVDQLLKVADAVYLKFINVVISRTLLREKQDQERTLQHTLNVWHHKGPFTSAQFLQMIQYKDDISNEEWGVHLNHHSGIQVIRPKGPQDGKTTEDK